ncbi:flavodoxin family protein [Acidaminococcus timonensis]|uniref:flavodoxin family protein n=1 Tax=Acidaminococcus timonensis TaxID=1871002 RepID=UPI0025CD59F4|nr:flavodoxin family protein [Acidaminococcus timonensis]
MKVLLLNGSRKEKGCTYTALSLVAKQLEAAGIDTEIIYIGLNAINGKLDELVKDVAAKMQDADGLVVGSPVYYASPSGEIQVFLDRFAGVAGAALRHKPAAAIASARRAGTSTTLDVLNKYLMYNEMPVVSSNYWNMVHGNTPEEVLQDKEGVQIMETLGKNMAWLLKSIEAGKKAGVEEPAKPPPPFPRWLST